MPRVKRGVKGARARKRVLKLAKGYWGSRSRRIRNASETVDRALVFAYRDRKKKKRDFRMLWIARINAAARLHGMTYSRLLKGLSQAQVALDRKVISHIAQKDPEGFKQLVDLAARQLA